MAMLRGIGPSDSRLHWIYILAAVLRKERMGEKHWTEVGVYIERLTILVMIVPTHRVVKGHKTQS